MFVPVGRSTLEEEPGELVGRSTLHRAVLLATVLALLAPFTPFVSSAQGGLLGLRDVVVERHELCSEDDLPETGLQGDVPKADQESGRAKLGYNCGLSLVGQTVVERAPGRNERARTGNANMAWVGDCAYVAGPGALFGPPSPESTWGVAVVDASDPGRPRHVTTLRTPGAVASSETLHAVETGDRAVLVVGQYGNVGNSDVPMDVYDVSDCADPRKLATLRWPENIHNLTVSGNGRYVFATQPLQVYDLDPLFDGDGATGARFLGNLEKHIPMPLVPIGPGADVDDILPRVVREARPNPVGTLAHEAWPSHDGSTLYIGGVTAQFEAVTIVDLSSWLTRDRRNRPAGQPRVISQRSGRGHSVRTATVHQGDEVRRFLLHSEESVFGLAYGCLPEKLNPFAGPAEPWLTEITDEANPVEVSQFGLEINQPGHCLSQLESGVNSSTHYHDVDDPDDTTFAMVSMWNAGLRVFDIRNPERPVEVAYFNPGDVGGNQVVLDQAWGHVRYVEETGHIWFATASGGFWVVELAPQVRDHLDLDDDGPPPASPRRPQGHPGTEGALPIQASLRLDLTPAYCTLDISIG